MRALGQPLRLLVLVIYLFLLFLASRLALGAWLPPTSVKGLWFYSGLASLLLGNLLITPFFTKPSDAVAYGVAAVVALLAVKPASLTPVDGLLWFAAMIYVSLPVIAGTLSIASKNARSQFFERTSRSLFFLADSLGAPTSVFSVVFLYSLVAYHRDSTIEFLIIGLAWALLVALRPLELLFGLLLRIAEVWQTSNASPFGELIGRQTPNLLLIRHDPERTVRFGDFLIVPGDDGQPNGALALDHVGHSDGRWLRATQLTLPPALRQALARSRDSITCLKGNRLAAAQVTDPIYVHSERLIGLVSPDTDIARLYFEIVRTDTSLGEGQLLSVRIGPHEVLYQIIAGLTKEEIVQQKNTRGYVRGQARKIGHWNPATLRFESIKWLPPPNAPVFLVQVATPPPNPLAIGYFPQTDYPVFVDVHHLVTHNAAILGVLGAGKSFLALELVERMITSGGLKVVCLDLTNQYAIQLASYYDQAAAAAEIDGLRAVGPPGQNNFRMNVEEGGSVRQFKQRLREILTDFLSPANPQRLKIFNPLQFQVWRQDSRMFNNMAAMAELTPTEITRLFAEVMLEAVQAQGMTDTARCCLVLEEAHSLIPEWTAVASEGDRGAANGTARAILQGRKFGFGCLVITQRTANVTKSILNQCNTIFALRVYDATGMEFLRTYIGDDYAGVLSTLEDRHAVVFGRASSCGDPILIRLNERQHFIAIFRPPAAAPALPVP